jgi:hypothetical protein
MYALSQSCFEAANALLKACGLSSSLRGGSSEAIDVSEELRLLHAPAGSTIELRPRDAACAVFYDVVDWLLRRLREAVERNRRRIVAAHLHGGEWYGSPIGNKVRKET